MSKKNKKRNRPSRREAERLEKLGIQQPMKKQKLELSPEDDDSHAFSMPQKQKHKQQPQQQQPKKQQQSNPAPKNTGAAAAAESSSSSAPAKKKKKQPTHATEPALPDIPEDEYNLTAAVDGHAIANGTAAGLAQNGMEMNSNTTAREFFEWLIYPMTIDSFYENYFEQKPLFISRRDIAAKVAKVTLVTTKKTLEEMLPKEGEAPETADNVSNKPASLSVNDKKTMENSLDSEHVTILEVPHPHSSSPLASSSSSSSSSSSPAHYYSNWFSIPEIHGLLRNASHDIHYKRDIDITRYKNGVRTTLNPEGRASEQQVKKFIEEDCSMRFLCPQKYSDKLWRMLNLLDEFFGMQTGANSYYTPKGTQGFAPHYDDVDVFVLQTEGSKRWRIYPPRAPNEILPSVSSRNYQQNEIGNPVLDVLLAAGDFLYAPRGAIHQCVASKEHHSLHVTLSTCLNTNWATYLGILLPRALQLASEEKIEFRRSLPVHYEKFMGVMNADRPSRGRREEFMDKTLELFTEMADLDLIPFDASADQMCTDFMHGRVPPKLTPAAFARTHKALSAKSPSLNGKSDKDGGKTKRLLKVTTCVRLVSDGIARLTTNPAGDQVTLHHFATNSRLFKETPLSGIDYPISCAMTLETLIKAYPKYMQISQIPTVEPEVDEDGNEIELPEEELMDELIGMMEQLFEEGLLEITNDINAVPQELRKVEGDSEEEEDEAAEEGEDDGAEAEDYEDLEGEEGEMGEDSDGAGDDDEYEMMEDEEGAEGGEGEEEDEDGEDDEEN